MSMCVLRTFVRDARDQDECIGLLVCKHLVGVNVVDVVLTQMTVQLALLSIDHCTCEYVCVS